MTSSSRFVACLLLASVSAELSLVQVQLLHRHGDRTPRFQLPLYPVNWPDVVGTELGQLTGAGVTQATALGRWLNERYIKTFSFLEPNYVPSHVTVRSTEIDRTIATGLAVLNGLFGNATLHDDIHNSTSRVYVPIRDVPVGEDVLMRGIDLCTDELTKRYNEMQQSDEWKNEMNKREEFLTWFKNVTGFTTLDLVHFYDSYDPVFGMYMHGLLPETIKARIDEVISLASFTENTRFRWAHSLAGGPLLRQWIENMVSRSSLTQKYFQFSAHDATIMALVQTMGIANTSAQFDQIPPFASALVVELWCDSANKTNDEFCRVMMHFRNGVTGQVAMNVVNQTLLQFIAKQRQNTLDEAGWCTACAPSTGWDYKSCPGACLRVPAPTCAPQNTDNDDEAKYKHMAAGFLAWACIVSVLFIGFGAWVWFGGKNKTSTNSVALLSDQA